MKNNSHKRGFTLLEIMIVVSLIGLLAAIAIPNMIRARMTSQTSCCINNLRQIDAAIQQWAMDQKKSSSATVSQSDVTPYLKNTAICPAGGTSFSDSYSVSTVDSGAVCLRSPVTHFIP